MDNKLKFFDEVFKLLLAIAVSIWLLYLMLVIFAGDTQGCTEAAWLFDATALAAGISSALPLMYGLIRLLLWPRGPKSTSIRLLGWILSIGAGIFVILVTVFALGVAQFGCQ